MSEFFPGQKVVSLTSTWKFTNKWKRLRERWFGRKAPDPIRNQVYTVARIVFANDCGLECLGLVEFPGSTVYAARNFRPLEQFKAKWVTKLSEDLRSGKPIEVVDAG